MKEGERHRTLNHIKTQSLKAYSKANVLVLYILLAAVLLGSRSYVFEGVRKEVKKEPKTKLRYKN